MRVGLPSCAGSPLGRLLLLVVLVAALPGSAHAQAPAPGPVEFLDPPTGVRPPVAETLRWTAAGAERFQCAVDAGPYTDCDSPWTVGPLGDGSHRFAVRGLAGDAVVAEGAHLWTVDAVKPVVRFLSGPSGPSPAGPAEVAFEGGEDTVGFECSRDGGDFDACTSPQEVTVTAGAGGELRVRALDAAGNVGDAAVRSWSGLAAAPAEPVITGAPTGTVRERTASLTFTADGAARFECAIDSPTFASCTSPRDLRGLADGPHVVEVRGVGADGTAGPVARAEWIVDGPPTVVLTRTPGSVEGTAAFSFTFTVDDTASTTRLACLVDGLPLPACTPGTPNPGTVAGSGEHTLVVRATDAAGNRGEASYTWRVDLEGPSVGILGKPADPSSADTAAFTLAPSADVESMLCRLTGPGRASAEPVTCDATPTYEGLTSGRYTFSVQAFDGLGNASLEVSHSWTVDRDAPVLALTAAPPATTAAATLQLAWSASEPVSGFTCTLDGVAFEPCGATVSVPNAALALGPHTFAVRAVDAAGNAGTAQAGWTTSFEPAFDWDPAAAVIERPLTFTSRSAGDLRALAWDVDDDGFDDGDGPTATRTFAEPGTYVVRLRVTHRDGEVRTLERQVTVGRTPLIVDPPVTPGPDRRPPVAGFGVAPQPPVAGRPVTLTSTSSDPDGAIASWAWDLDGDGAFDDAAGPAAARSFPAGTHIVGLLVVDADGLSATAFASVEVAPAPGTGGPAPAVAKKLARLTPFPVVRIAGTAVGSRVRLRIFAVRAPRNTTVDVRCKGRGCPLKTFRQRVTGKTRTVRVRKLEQRALRAGTVIEVRVLAAGRIGKYTRLVMRSGAAPRRTDACVSGTRSLKIACPA